MNWGIYIKKLIFFIFLFIGLFSLNNYKIFAGVVFGDSPYWISEKNQGIDGTGYYYFNDYFQPEYSQPFENYKYIWKNETKVSKLAGTEWNSYDVCKPIGTWSNIQNGDKKIEIIVEYYTTNKIGTYCKVLDFNSL